MQVRVTLSKSNTWAYWAVKSDTFTHRLNVINGFEEKDTSNENFRHVLDLSHKEIDDQTTFFSRLTRDFWKGNCSTSF